MILTCVDADADASLVFDLGDDVSEVFEGGPDDVAASGHVLEDGFDGLGFYVGTIEGRSYTGDCVGARSGAGVPRVKVVEFNAEGFAAFQVVHEGVVGLFCFRGVFLGEVDEVRTVGEDVSI